MEKMTGRERVRRAIHFQGPDRLPHFLPDGGENDLIWLWPKRDEDIAWTQTEDGRWRRLDAWSTQWSRIGPEGNGEVEQPGLPDWSELAAYRFPDWNGPAAYAEGRAEIATNADGKYVLGVMPFAGIFEGVAHVRRMDNFMLDFYTHPAELDVLFGRFADAQIESIDCWKDAGADGIMGYDDLGLQERPMIGPALFRRVLLPHYARVWQYAHSLGLDVWLHSCGYIMPLLDDMIGAGLNVIQMDQQENMGIAELGRRFGGRLAFWCPVDIQKTMVYGSAEDIENYVREMVRCLGSYRGGLISKYYPQPDMCGHDPAKTATMCRAFRANEMLSSPHAMR
jgi:uroporphyrinogen decarboxylase